MSNIKRFEISDGVFCNLVESDKFKTCRVSVTMLLPLDEEKTAHFALLPQLLTRSCKCFPDFIQLNKHLDAMYGTNLYSHARKMGDAIAMTVSMSFLDDKYTINGENISKKLVLLLQEIIFNPNVTNEAFNETDVSIEKAQLLDTIDSEYNNKRVYAISTMLKKMCENETYGTKYYGSYEQVENTTSHDIYKAWKYVLKNARFEILAIGNKTLFDCIKCFESSFKNIERTPVEIKNENISNVDKVKEFDETIDISQAKLVMGFRTPYSEPQNTYIARLTSDILGGNVTSKFFTNIREKLSLCYYCAVRFDKNKGIFIVDSGVENSNIEKTKNEILKNIKALQDGNLSDFEINSSKLSMVNHFNMMSDTTSDIEMWYLSQLFSDKILTPKEASEMITNITAQQVIEAANNFVLDTVFVLKGN